MPGEKDHLKYFKIFEVLWTDVDPNGHMRHTAYSDYSTNVRFGFLSSIGFNYYTLLELKIGPVIFHEFIEYKREVLLGDVIRIGVELKGSSADCNRWLMRHRIFNEKLNKLVCVIHLEGGWLDLQTRKLCPPPDKIINGFDILKIEDYKTLGQKFSLRLKKT